MAAFIAGQRENPIKGEPPIPCLVNVDRVVEILHKREAGGGLKMGWCLAALDDGTTVDLHVAFSDLETIAHGALLAQVDHAREQIRNLRG